MQTKFWLNGVFFQRWSVTGPWGEVDRPCARHAVREPRLQSFPFAGMIWWDPQRGELIGMTCDQFGWARLSRVEIGDLFARFAKTYTTRNDVIDYEFRERQGDDFVGLYRGEHVDQGLARCRVTPIAESDFSFETIATTLGLRPHEY